MLEQTFCRHCAAFPVKGDIKERVDVSKVVSKVFGGSEWLSLRFRSVQVQAHLNDRGSVNSVVSKRWFELGPESKFPHLELTSS